MTKVEWEEIRNMNEIPISLWFEYYTEMGGFIKDINEFQSILWQVLAKGLIFIVQGKPRRLSFDSAVNRIYEYYSNKFSE